VFHLGGETKREWKQDANTAQHKGEANMVSDGKKADGPRQSGWLSVEVSAGGPGAGAGRLKASGKSGCAAGV
jgi:N-methylhydantoinase B/oxoprolinase/acetone carboxylase alpha subunit